MTTATVHTVDTDPDDLNETGAAARAAATAAARVIIEGEYALFARFAGPAGTFTDIDQTITDLMVATARGKTFIENGIFAYNRLSQLPKLRDLQHAHRILDLPRLSAINRATSVLPPSTTPDQWDLIDTALTATITRSLHGSPLPSVWTITHQLRKLIATVDATVNFDPVKRKKREHTPPRAPHATIEPATDDTPRHELRLVADNTTMAIIRARATATARKHKLSLADALTAMLTGDLSTAVRPVLNFYTPHPADENRPIGENPVYIDGTGWATADDLDALTALLDAAGYTTADLDTAAATHTDSYTPTTKMAAYVRLRDGTCIYPGCHTPASRCQLDHRIPFDRGGPTTPENLFALCQHHHNRKTDKHAFYVPDPATGAIVWLFANGTWTTTHPNGILRQYTTPSNPRWSTTLNNRHAAADRISRFHAACHTACDAYEATGDYATCVTTIRNLEKQYAQSFPFTPPPPEEESVFC